MSVTVLGALRLEVEITPRWFSTGPHLLDDGADILRAIRDSESALKPLILDVQIGTTGVRLVLAVPPEQGTSGFDKARFALVSMLDAMDGGHPRRMRTTQDREKAKQAAEAAAVLPVEPEAPPKNRRKS